MDRKHIHTVVSTRALCPVCKKPVYSKAGIHPQCAMLQADPGWMAAKRKKLEAVATATKTADQAKQN